MVGDYGPGVIVRGWLSYHLLICMWTCTSMSFLKPVSEKDFCSVDNTIIMLCLVVEDVRDSEHVNRVTLYVEITLYKIDRCHLRN